MGLHQSVCLFLCMGVCVCVCGLAEQSLSLKAARVMAVRLGRKELRAIKEERKREHFGVGYNSSSSRKQREGGEYGYQDATRSTSTTFLTVVSSNSCIYITQRVVL